MVHLSYVNTQVINHIDYSMEEGSAVLMPIIQTQSIGTVLTSDSAAQEWHVVLIPTNKEDAESSYLAIKIQKL